MRVFSFGADSGGFWYLVMVFFWELNLNQLDYNANNNSPCLLLPLCK